MGKDITFENKPTVKNSMQFYKEYFNRMGNGYRSKNKIDQELKTKPITGKDMKECKHAVERLNKFAEEYSLEPISSK